MESRRIPGRDLLSAPTAEQALVFPSSMATLPKICSKQTGLVRSDWVVAALMMTTQTGSALGVATDGLSPGSPGSDLKPESFPRRAVNGNVENREMSKILRLPAARQTGPSTVNGKVSPPRRRKNRERRTREYLTPAEVERMITAAGTLGRHGHRDRTMILLAYRHALREVDPGSWTGGMKV